MEEFDLIFRYNVQSPLDQLIAECGLNYGNILLNHVGLYLGNNRVIESNKNGVVITSTNDFCQGKIYVKRLIFRLSKLQKELLNKKALSYLDVKYNFSYEDSQDDLYCSELIIAIFNALADINPFKRHCITFNNALSNKLDERWLLYYKEASSIPNNVMGSHPTSLFVNKSLQLI